jgi:hypothetical protein
LGFIFLLKIPAQILFAFSVMASGCNFAFITALLQPYLTQVSHSVWNIQYEMSISIFFQMPTDTVIRLFAVWDVTNDYWMCVLRPSGYICHFPFSRGLAHRSNKLKFIPSLPVFGSLHFTHWFLLRRSSALPTVATVNYNLLYQSRDFGRLSSAFYSATGNPELKRVLFTPQS